MVHVPPTSKRPHPLGVWNCMAGTRSLDVRLDNMPARATKQARRMVASIPFCRPQVCEINMRRLYNRLPHGGWGLRIGPLWFERIPPSCDITMLNFGTSWKNRVVWICTLIVYPAGMVDGWFPLLPAFTFSSHRFKGGLWHEFQPDGTQSSHWSLHKDNVFITSTGQILVQDVPLPIGEPEVTDLQQWLKCNTPRQLYA